MKTKTLLIFAGVAVVGLGLLYWFTKPDVVSSSGTGGTVGGNKFAGGMWAGIIGIVGETFRGTAGIIEASRAKDDQKVDNTAQG